MVNNVKLKKVENVKARSVTTTSAKVSWTKVKQATAYEVYKVSGTKTKLIEKVKTNSIQLDGIKAYGSIKVKVRAYNITNGKVVYGKYSDVYTVYCRPASTKITLKSGIKKIKISWKKCSGADGYAVYGAKTKDGTFRKIADTTSLTFVKTNLKGGARYYFKVRAYKNAYGRKFYGEYSSVKSATTYVSAKIKKNADVYKSAKFASKKIGSVTSGKSVAVIAKKGIGTKSRLVHLSAMFITRLSVQLKIPAE